MDYWRRKFLNFFADAGRHCSHMNIWRCDIAQLTVTFSSACETQLHCQLHRRVPAPHGPGNSSIHTLLLCITELAIWAVSCHIKYDYFFLEIGITNLPFHHVPVSVSVSVSKSKSISIYLYLYPRQNQNLHIGLRVHVTFQDIQCCWILLHLVHEIITFTAVEMGMYDQVVSCHPLVWIQPNRRVRTRQLVRDAD